MFVLSEGLIKQQFAKSLAAAVLLSAVGATTASAQSLGPLSDALNAINAPRISSETDSVTQSVTQRDATAAQLATANLPVEDAFTEANASEKEFSPTDALAINGSETGPEAGLQSDLDSAASGEELIPSLNSNILVHAHAVDGRQAATLYVKNIPVLTFIGTEVDSLSRTGDAVAIASSAPASLELSATVAAEGLTGEADPVSRATTLGNQLDSETLDATDISVRWNEETEGYTVTLADADLISLDNRTILADTTQDPAEDALQVTNRLRRLIGSAEPISEIEGLPEPPAPAQTVAIVSTNVGGASWYGPGFDGRLSASGEVFNQNALTAAHRTLPFGTRVLVTNLNNGRQVTVRINDRGPFSGGRIIDLSAGAAAEIGLINSGVATVQLDVLAN